MSNLLASLAEVVSDIIFTLETTVVTTQYATSTATAPRAAEITDAATTTTSSSTTSTSTGPPTSTPFSFTSATASYSSSASISSLATSLPLSSFTLSAMPLSPTASQVQPTEEIASSSSSSTPIVSSLVTSAATLSTIVKPLATSEATTSIARGLSSASSSLPAASSANDQTAIVQADHKPAIIGGLVGAIGGVVLVALIIFFCCLRRRRRKHDKEASNHYFDVQYQPRPAPPRMHTGASEMNFGYAAPLRRPVSSSVKSFKSANGNLIRLNITHFARPFSEQESWRDSNQPGRLRVTNPDRSLPSTPNLAADRLSDPFSQIKPLYQTTFSTRETSAYNADNIKKLPVVHIDETLSRECVVPISHGTPSFRSYSSIHTSPPASRHLANAPYHPMPALPDRVKPKRPTLSPLHSIASRTLSSIGSAFRLSSSKATGDDQEKGLQASHQTRDSWGCSSQRASALSDPFELDNPMRRSMATPDSRPGLPSHTGYFTTHAGT